MAQIQSRWVSEPRPKGTCSLAGRSPERLAGISVLIYAVTLVPFSAALLAHFPTHKVALVEYWLNIVLLGAMLLAGLEYGLRAHLFKRHPSATSPT